MSLVICSNKENDRTDGTDSSIYEPFSFRNGLSSTYNIPKNAQVGLHSCKINLNGTMTLSGNEVMNQYFGLLLDEDVGDTIALSSSHPIATPLDEVQYKRGRAGRFTDYGPEGVADLVKAQMNRFIFHPNLKDKADCDVNRDPTTNEFTGYDFTYDQYADETTSTIPSATQAWTLNPRDLDDAVGAAISPAERQYYPGGVFTDTNNDLPLPYPDAALTWNYEVVGTEGIFKSIAVAQNGRMNAMINTSLPLSLYNGQMTVNIKDVNDADIDWFVGLSRFVENEFSAVQYGEQYAPSNFDSDRTPNADQIDEFFSDYVVRRSGDLLYVQHLAMNSDPTFDTDTDTDATFMKNLEYWTLAGATIVAQYDLSTNTDLFEKVRFTANGQTLKIEMLVADDTPTTVYSFDESHTKALQLPPIHQGCWCLHPVLGMESTVAKSDGIMNIEVFEGCKDIVNYGWTGGKTNMGWYEYGFEGGFPIDLVAQLEERYWFDQYDTTSGKNADGQLRYASVPTSGNHRRIGYVAGTDGTGAKVAGFSEVVIPGTTNIYPSKGNMTEKLGFNQPYDKVFAHIGAGASDLGVKFVSDMAPVFKSGQSIFVRLTNLTQRSMNAFKGNNSQIIAHLPRFDGQAETGRLFYEPSEIMWLDLDNPEALKVSSFDLSFVYVNEQFCRALTGQSIVVLAFRPKPK